MRAATPLTAMVMLVLMATGAGPAAAGVLPARGALTVGTPGGQDAQMSAYDTTHAGDIDGDGRADIAVGDFRATGAIFGRAGLAGLDGLDWNTVEAQELLFTTPLDEHARGARGAGDVNGDGLADIAVGVANANFTVWQTRIAFGRGAGVADIADGAPGGFRITSSEPFTRPVRETIALGDVDGDGRDDLAVGTGFTGDPQDVRFVIVYGRTSESNVDIADPGPDERVVRGFATDRVALQPAGDVDGDGLQDIALRGDPGDGLRSVVVWGAGTRPDLDLRAIGTAGVPVTAPADTTVPVGLGDVDGDGRDDLGFGVRPLTAWTSLTRAVGYVRLGIGTRGAISASDPGIVIRTPLFSGAELWPLGDVTGDGRDDVGVETAGNDPVTIVGSGRGTRALPAAAPRPPALLLAGRGAGTVTIDDPLRTPGLTALYGASTFTPRPAPGTSRDIDGDGHADVLVSRTVTATQILRGHGDGVDPPVDTSPPMFGMTAAGTPWPSLPSALRTDERVVLCLTFTLNEPATVRLQFRSLWWGITRTRTGGWPAGTSRLCFDGRGGQGTPKLEMGQWRVTATATDAAGQAGIPVARTFTSVG